jgi:ABC-2 type transport system ATP-binding protein
VFISSHLLDEVEKICDAAAIVDRGRVITQGPISELAAEDARAELIVTVDDTELALDVIAATELAHDVRRIEEGLRVAIRPGAAASELNTALVGAGLAVSRLEPVRQSLERRFLEITTPLDGDERLKVAA